MVIAMQYYSFVTMTLIIMTTKNFYNLFVILILVSSKIITTKLLIIIITTMTYHCYFCCSYSSDRYSSLGFRKSWFCLLPRFMQPKALLEGRLKGGFNRFP